MAKVMIINGSPRAPISNSKKYAELFISNFHGTAEYCYVTRKNTIELCKKMENFSDVLFVFPLYVDSIPVTLLNFLKILEENPPKVKPKISVLINCGFIEPYQNDVAIKIMKFFCKKCSYQFASILQIGGGEAILNTPFKIFVNRKIKKLAKAIADENIVCLKTTMLLPKKLFIKASTKYWKNHGMKNGVTYEQMTSMEIEK